MARRAKVGYWKTRGGYGIVLKGKQHILAVGPDDYDIKGKHGPTYLAATKAHAELVVYGAADKAGDANTVRVLCERYAEFLEHHREASTLARFKREASFFVDQYGEQTVGSLKPFHLDKFSVWLKTERNWTNTGFAMQLVKNAFVWGVKKKVITNNPFEGVELEGHTPNTKSQVISKADAEAVFKASSVHLRDLLRLLWDTGCRPDEAYHLQAKDYDRENKCIVYSKNAKRPEYVWKNAKKSQKDRVIYLMPEMVEMVEAKIAQRPTGYLFQTKFGKRWNREKVCQQLRQRIQQTHGVGFGVTPYAFRHTYITNRLRGGGSIKVVADLCGTSVDQIEKTYSHIHDDKKGMRELMMQMVTSENA